MPISARGSVIGVPPARIVPSVTASRPAIIIKSVLLPQPLGPRRQTNSPFSIGERRGGHSLERSRPLAEDLAYALAADLRLHARCAYALAQKLHVFLRARCALGPFRGVNVTLPSVIVAAECLRFWRAHGRLAPPHTASPPSPARRFWPDRYSRLHAPWIRALP